MEHPIRILLAKIGLDGHDRGVKLLARSFRDAGLEVIYTGLWQTPQATVHAALQEDVDVLGVSLHSAAHMTIMPEVLRWQTHYGIQDIPAILGGIVPQADIPALREMGVSAVFNPGSALADILAAVRELAARRTPENEDRLWEGYARGDIRSLARLITRAQRGGVGDPPHRTTGAARVFGVTGSPGVGKSSFIAKLAALLRRRGQKVAVVAVDPTSPVTGGALLGDRLRMMHAEPEDAFFVRSMASSDQQGGLGPDIGKIIELLDGFGFDTILVETVGAGQGDTAIAGLTRRILLLLMPQSGDDIQFSKAGIMEIAAAYVINKCDLPGADATHAHLAETQPGRPVWRVSALHDRGLDEVADWVAQQSQ